MIGLDSGSGTECEVDFPKVQGLLAVVATALNPLHSKNLLNTLSRSLLDGAQFSIRHPAEFGIQAQGRTMSRWVLSNRRAGKFSQDAKASSLHAIKEAEVRLRARESEGYALRVVGAQGNEAPDSPGRRVVVVEAPAGEIEEQRRRFSGDVIVEPEILHFPTITLPLHVRNVFTIPAVNSPDLAGNGETLDITIKEFRGSAIAGAMATLFLRGPSGYVIQQPIVSDDNGQVTFRFHGVWKPVSMTIVPAFGYWAKFVRAPANNSTVYLTALPKPSHNNWWHQTHGSTKVDSDHGKGVRIGVVDTGCGEHPSLAHVTRLGAWVEKKFDPLGGSDVEQHGTHVTGIIAGRKFGTGDDAGKLGWNGLAPGAEVFTVRVFKDKASGASQADIALAIDHLSNEMNVDLINLSLGSETRSEIERDSIQDAMERGTICICAAGNSGVEGVLYPAAFEECVAVSAIGYEGWEPAESLSGMNYPDDRSRFSYRGVYVASFSCWGDAIDCAGAGVGIIGPVPIPIEKNVDPETRVDHEKCYAALDGTSMAAPAVTAALAVKLSSRQKDYLDLPRDLTRAQQARDILRRYCRDLGLSAKLQGRGVPQIN